jgi:hypothetical protein
MPPPFSIVDNFLDSFDEKCLRVYTFRRTFELVLRCVGEVRDDFL